MEQKFTDILIGCTQRDRRYQKELYKLFYSHGMRVGYAHVGNEQEAIEILNNSFIKVYSNLSGYETIAEFKDWFTEIVEETSAEYLHTRNQYSENYSASRQLSLV